MASSSSLKFQGTPIGTITVPTVQPLPSVLAKRGHLIYTAIEWAKHIGCSLLGHGHEILAGPAADKSLENSEVGLKDFEDEGAGKTEVSLGQNELSGVEQSVANGVEQSILDGIEQGMITKEDVGPSNLKVLDTDEMETEFEDFGRVPLGPTPTASKAVILYAPHEFKLLKRPRSNSANLAEPARKKLAKAIGQHRTRAYRRGGLKIDPPASAQVLRPTVIIDISNNPVPTSHNSIYPPVPKEANSKLTHSGPADDAVIAFLNNLNQELSLKHPQLFATTTSNNIHVTPTKPARHRKLYKRMVRAQAVDFFDEEIPEHIYEVYEIQGLGGSLAEVLGGGA